jgi:hypothetical protein
MDSQAARTQEWGPIGGSIQNSAADACFTGTTARSDLLRLPYSGRLEDQEVQREGCSDSARPDPQNAKASSTDMLAHVSVTDARPVILTPQYTYEPLAGANMIRVFELLRGNSTDDVICIRLGAIPVDSREA